MHTIHRLVTRSFAPIALIGAASLLGPACSSDTQPGQPEAGTPEGGTGGKAAGGSAGKGAGGSAGTATGGQAGAAAGGSAALDASVTDAIAADSSADARGEAGPTAESVLCAEGRGNATATLLAAATTFCQKGVDGGSACTTSEVAAIDLAHDCVLGRASFPDTDVVPRASGGHGYVIERTNGVISTLGVKATITARIDLKLADGGGKPANPHDIVYAHPTGGVEKAYVSLYDGDAIAVIDLASGTVSKHIDLSTFKDASDTDGSSDPDVGFYDATTGRVYFVLQRTDITTAYVMPYVVHCPPVTSLLVAIDASTDTLVDLNGAAAGVALPLSLIAPADVAIDVAGRRALLLSSGCVDATSKRVKAGVESVNLDTLIDTALYAAPSAGFLNHIALLAPDSAALQGFDDNSVTLWNRWAPTSPSLGAALAGVPDFAIAEGADSLVGVSSGTGAPRIARYNPSTQVATTVVSVPWTRDAASAVGVALVK